MMLSVYIARRYLFSRKKHNAVNVISAVSVCGVALATLALVCTLSVFNGFKSLVGDLFTAFDPQLKIQPAQGKVLDVNDKRLQDLRLWPEVEVFCPTLEENAMLQYHDRQRVVMLKGVDDNFQQLTRIDSILFGARHFELRDSVADYALMGIQLVSVLGTGIKFVDPLTVYAPKRHARVNINNPSTAFTEMHLFSPGAVFAVMQEKYDAHYVLTSLDFARRLFDYDTEASAIELKLRADADPVLVKQRISAMLGDEFQVLDRYEQQVNVYRLMEIEKLIAYLFLTFILLVACFNVIGSLSMLILDKRDDAQTLRNMGADNRLIRRIFFAEGCMISLFGALIGIVLGVGLCLLQQAFGFIKLNGGSTFIIEAYPVRVQADDVALIFMTVVCIGMLAVWWPVRYLSRKHALSIQE